MTPSDLCKAWNKHCEGCTLVAKWDVNGWAIGYGYHGPDITRDTVWTQEQADQHFLDFIDNVAAPVVNELVKVPLTQGQFDALTGFSYQYGQSKMASSTMLRQLNAGLYDSARDSLYWQDEQGNPHGWIYIDGQISTGLIARRKGDQVLWNGGNPLEGA